MIVLVEQFTGTFEEFTDIISVYFDTVTRTVSVSVVDSVSGDPVVDIRTYETTDREWDFEAEYTERSLYDYCDGTSKIVVFAIEAYPYADFIELLEQADCEPQEGCTIGIGSVSKTDETATGANNGSVTGTVVGASCEGVEYSINGFVFQSTPLFTGLAPGTYNYTVKDCAGCIASEAFAIAAYIPPAPDPEENRKKFDPVFNEISIYANSFNSTQPGFKFIFDVYVNGVQVARRKQSPIYNDFQNALFDVSPIIKNFVTTGDFRKGNLSNVINVNDESFIQYEVKIGESYGGVDYPALKTTGIRYAYSACLRELERYTFITDDFKIFGNGCEILTEVDGGTIDDPVGFVVGYFNGNTAPAGVDTCPATNTVDGGLSDEALDTVNFLIDGNPPYVGQDGYNTTPNSVKKFLTFADRWQNIALNETFQLSILAEPGFEFSKLKVKTYSAIGVLVQNVILENADGVAHTHLQIKGGPRDLNRISPGLISASVAHYKIQIVGSEDAPLSEEFGFRIVPGCSRYEIYRLHYLNRLGGYDAFTFNKANRKITKIERRSYQRNTGSKTGTNNFLSSPYRFDTARLNYGITSSQNITLNSDWINLRQSELFEDLFSSPLVYLESNKIEWGAKDNFPVFVPVNIVNTEYETQTKGKVKVFNISLEIELGVSNKRQTQ